MMLLNLCFTLLISLFSFKSTSSFMLAKCSKNSNQQNVILNTTHGQVQGSCQFVTVNDNNSKEVKSGNVYSWLGIPYAEPPIGPYRFRKTVEKKPWDDILKATEKPKACVQELSETNNDSFLGSAMWSLSDPSEISEDCLYLNVHVPAEAYLRINLYNVNEKAPKSPIVVFFHGGSTVSGSSSLDVYDPLTFVAATNVIFVSVNYRLGVYGFLHLEGEFPGNQALLDQNEALRWVKNNAERFGGDSDKITLIGHSAGATLTGLHLFYKESWGLFRNLVLQSGTPLMPSLMPISKIEANERAKKFLSLVGCSEESDLATCAQNADNVFESSVQFFENMSNQDKITSSYLFTAFPPVIDGEILTESPLKSLENGNFKKCPIITGFTVHEGSSFVGWSGLLGSKDSEIQKANFLNHQTLVSFISSYLNFYPKYPNQSNKLIINSIVHEYTKFVENANLDKNYFDSLNKIIGHEMVICPAYKFLDKMAKHNNQTYLYLFAHRPSSTPWPSWYGSTHGDDLAMTFAYPISDTSDENVSLNPWSKPKYPYPKSEKDLSTDIISYFANFARFNAPNKQTLKFWPTYNYPRVNQTGNYMVLKTNDLRVSRGFCADYCQFWNSYLPKLISNIDETLKKQASQQSVPYACPNDMNTKMASQANINENVYNNASMRFNLEIKLLSFLLSFVFVRFFLN